MQNFSCGCKEAMSFELEVWVRLFKVLGLSEGLWFGREGFLSGWVRSIHGEVEITKLDLY